MMQVQAASCLALHRQLALKKRAPRTLFPLKTRAKPKTHTPTCRAVWELGTSGAKAPNLRPACDQIFSWQHPTLTKTGKSGLFDCRSTN